MYLPNTKSQNELAVNANTKLRFTAIWNTCNECSCINKVFWFLSFFHVKCKCLLCAQARVLVGLKHIWFRSSHLIFSASEAKSSEKYSMNQSLSFKLIILFECIFLLGTLKLFKMKSRNIKKIYQDFDNIKNNDNTEFV